MPPKALRILPLAYRAYSSDAHSKKGEIMIRGHFSFHPVLLVLLGAAVAAAQGPAPEASDATSPLPKITETVVVTAPGEFRVEQEMQSAVLLEETPGTSPIQSVAQLPSVNFQAADPYGSYEWAVRISVRGFNQNQLGFTLDDIPLGDMSYGNWNGLHISRAITDENVGRIVVSQGAGALETASTSNLGGTLQFYSADPSDKRSFTVNQTLGSWNAYRTFARFESGLIGHTKFYLTGAYNLTDKWRGHGDIGQNYWQLNGKLVHYVGSKGVLSVFADVSDRREVDYQDDNKVWAQKLGYNWDNYGNWAQSIQAAWAYDGVGSYPTVLAPLGPTAADYNNNDAIDAAYYGGSGLRKDQIAGISYKTALTDQLTFKVIGYGHHDDGRGLWFTPYLPTYSDFYADYGTSNGILSPISLRTSEYQINRAGAIASLAYENGRNKVEGGVWFEGERWNLARRFYATSETDPLHSLYSFPSNPFFTQWEYVFNSEVYHLHLQDAFHVNDKLTLSAGFKTVETTTDGELSKTFLNTPSPVYTPGGYAQGKLTSGKPFLPQFGANFKLAEGSEIFGDAAYNVRSYMPGGNGYGTSPWGTSGGQPAFNALKKTTNPETSWTEEAGYRYTSKRASAQASYFHVNFHDRLLAFSQGAGIAGNASILANAGGVTTNGVDGSVSIRITPEITLYNAATWNKSAYDSNTGKSGACIYAAADGSCRPLKGLIVVDTPKALYKSSLEYKKSGAFARIGADYMSKRYFTYSNDNSVPDRFLTDLSLGYGRADLGAFKDLKIQANASDLLNSQYYASIGTNGFIYSDPTSVSNNTLQVGAPRTISGTISVRF
jgi:iron complex outermembrane receptor protein